MNPRIALVLSVGLFACGSSDSSGGFAASGASNDTTATPGAPSGGTGFSTGAPAAGTSGGGATGGTSSTLWASSDGGAVQSQAGILTAGIWDDGLNYSFFGSYLASHTGISGDPGFATSDYDASHAQFAQRAAHSVIDAALVLDTTGSMGDEISYLTSELASITSAISAAYPNADQRWALVVYRDTPDTDPGDAYVVESVDFTSSAQAFAATVGAQTAANGGDYPESPEIGLEQLQKLTWRTDPAVAKVAFWVADAPQHTYRAAAMKQAIVDAHTAGIHIYPVSASGTDDLLELTMRTAAEITGGRYLFLTDDSGVGDPHKVPEIPCYYVTRLEKALVRVASMELTGSYIGPNPADVLRVSGNASPDGTCTVEDDGGEVQIF
jgi:hypothetical protein